MGLRLKCGKDIMVVTQVVVVLDRGFEIVIAAVILSIWKISHASTDLTTHVS
jgi:hypothetical protein